MAQIQPPAGNRDAGLRLLRRISSFGRFGIAGVAIGIIVGLTTGLLAGGAPAQVGSRPSVRPPDRLVALQVVATATPSPRPTATATPVPPTPAPPPPTAAPAPPAPVVRRAPVVVGGGQPAATPVAYADPAKAQQLLALINSERLKAGVGPLASSGALTAAAQAQAQAMATMGAVSHLSPDGAPLDVRVQRAGYYGWAALAENVAQGPSGPDGVIALWLASPAHRDNLLNAAYNEAGTGCYFITGLGNFWVLDLGKR